VLFPSLDCTVSVLASQWAASGQSNQVGRMRPTNLWSGLTARATAQEASPLLTVPLPSTQTPAGSDHQPRAVLTVLPNSSGEAGMGYSTCTVVITGVKRLDLKAPSLQRTASLGVSFCHRMGTAESRPEPLIEHLGKGSGQPWEHR